MLFSNIFPALLLPERFHPNCHAVFGCFEHLLVKWLEWMMYHSTFSYSYSFEHYPPISNVFEKCLKWDCYTQKEQQLLNNMFLKITPCNHNILHVSDCVYTPDATKLIMEKKCDVKICSILKDPKKMIRSINKWAMKQ